MNGIESVKTSAPDDGNYERLETPAGSSFKLLAANNLVIGNSQVYTSASGRDNGIESVKKNASDADVIEILIREVK